METISIGSFPPNTSILLGKNFLKELRAKMQAADKIIIKQNTKGFRKLEIIIPMCKKYNLSLDELQSNTLSYRTTKGRVTVKNPTLPIEVSPIFDMVIAHIIGDGHCTKITGRLPSFVYVQFKNEILNLFIKKLERIFGDLQYERNYFYKNKRVYVPSSLAYVMYNYYEMLPEDFMENNSELPEKMLKQNKENILAVLIAFILDEGHIDSSNIVIGLYNKKLLAGIKKICDILNYENIMKTDRHGRSFLYILSAGVKKFWLDYNKLKEKYPEVSLDYKEKQIEEYIIRKNKLWRTAEQGETQNRIIGILKESKRTVRDMSEILQISRQGVKWHLSQLEKTGVVKRAGKGYAGSDLYNLQRYTVIETKKKGRSRQYDITHEKIIQLLNEKPLSTKEIADELKISRATVLHFLLNLEKNSKIKRGGKRIHRTHPSIVWSASS